MGAEPLALAGVAFALGAGAAAPAGARPDPGPTVDLHSAAPLAPDGRSLTVQLFASCPERWTVTRAVVHVSQPQASGAASFTVQPTVSVALAETARIGGGGSAAIIGVTVACPVGAIPQLPRVR